MMDPLTSKQIKVGAKWSVGDIQIDKGLQYYASATRPWRVLLLPEQRGGRHDGDAAPGVQAQ